MPLKSGKFLPQERAFVANMAKHGNAAEAARAAGYSSPQMYGPTLAKKPELARAIVEAQMERIRTDGVTAAAGFLVEILGNATAPAGARVQAAKLVFDLALRDQEDSAEKPLNAMSRAELVDAAAKARAYIEELDAVVIDHEPGGVFD